MSRRFLFEIDVPDKLNLGRRVIGILIIMVSLGFMVFFWYILTEAGNNTSRAKLQSQAESVIDIAEGRIAGYSDILYGIRSLYLTNGGVTEKQWLAYVSTQNAYERYPGLGNIAYAKAKDEEGNSIAKIEHVLKYETIPVVGLDLRKLERVSDVFDKTILSEAPAATAAFDSLLLDRSGNKDVLIVLALYDEPLPQGASAEYKQQHVSGYGIITIYPSRIFNTIFSDVNLSESVGFTLTDGDTLIYERGFSDYSSGYISQTTLMDVGGREWTLRFVAADGYGLSMFERLTPVLFAVGYTVFVVSFLSLYLYRIGVKIRIKYPIKSS